MMLPFVAGLLLAYGGMVGLCQGMERNFRLVWKRSRRRCCAIHCA